MIIFKNFQRFSMAAFNYKYTDTFMNVMKWQKLTFYCSSANMNNNGNNYKDNNTVREITQYWRQRFEEAGVPEPIESIEHIIAHVIGRGKIIDIMNCQEKKLNDEQRKMLNSLCDCRLLRMPIQYIIGEWQFRDITLKLVPPVFIPRPETEILVDLVLKYVTSMDLTIWKVLDIGCGSGAISLALAHSCKKIECTAIDANIHACHLTIENAQNLNLIKNIMIINATLMNDGTIKTSQTLLNNNDMNWNIANQFDIIVSNPPYIPTKEVFNLDREIRIFEDVQALDGGVDGLKIIKPLLKYAAFALKPHGRLFMEVDPGQPQYIKFFTEKYSRFKLQHVNTYKDFCSNERFVEVLKLG